MLGDLVGKENRDVNRITDIHASVQLVIKYPFKVVILGTV